MELKFKVKYQADTLHYVILSHKEDGSLRIQRFQACLTQTTMKKESKHNFPAFRWMRLNWARQQIMRDIRKERKSFSTLTKLLSS